MRHGRVGFRLAGRLLPSGQVNTVRFIENDDSWSPGTEIWELDGQLHREGGPAIIWPDGSEEWYFHDQLHREGGPAITEPDGTEEYWELGERIQ